MKKDFHIINVNVKLKRRIQFARNSNSLLSVHFSITLRQGTVRMRSSSNRGRSIIIAIALDRGRKAVVDDLDRGRNAVVDARPAGIV